MSSTKESVRVDIFGYEFSIFSDVDSETTKEIAHYVHSKMTDIHKQSTSRDQVKIAVLSALNIAGELFESKEKCIKQEQTISEMQKRINTLTKKVNGILQH
jgi:cell division protein ZapA